MDIAKAYNVECASILEHGPKTPQLGCMGRDVANTIFNETFEKLKRITRRR